MPRPQTYDPDAMLLGWNKRHPVGTVVLLGRSDGSLTYAKTRSVAELSRDGKPVVSLRGIAGDKPLDHIFDVPTPLVALREMVVDAEAVARNSYGTTDSGMINEADWKRVDLSGFNLFKRAKAAIAATEVA